jgi:hypothetical protein
MPAHVFSAMTSQTDPDSDAGAAGAADAPLQTCRSGGQRPRFAPAPDAHPLRIAMIGMIEGNGHPYSWSAIVNGFDPAAMQRCPFPAIRAYLGAQPAGGVGIAGARVTHVWTDSPADAPLVAAASLIPNVLARPEDAIGRVDGVIIATDDGDGHARRARPFVEAGLPVFVDKPLATSPGDLRIFAQWQNAGARLLSSSGVRYAPEFDALFAGNGGPGELRWISGVCCKTWERYGMHILEPIFRLLGAGFESVRIETGARPGIETAHLLHRSGVQVTVPVIADGGAAFAHFQIAGAGGLAAFRHTDTYTAFRRQMLACINFFRGGGEPYPFSDTIELCAILIAGARSRAQDNRRVAVAEILQELSVSK